MIEQQIEDALLEMAAIEAFEGDEPQPDDRMDEAELMGIVDREIGAAKRLYQGGTVSDERADALDYYHAEPRGDEVPNRSKVISTDVQDVVEWILPEVIDTYAANQEAIEFDAVEDGDELQAKLETAAVSKAFWKDAGGFLVLYTAVKDALISKTGIVKITWDDAERLEREQYAGLTMQQVQALQMPQDRSRVEIAEAVQSGEVQTDLGPVPLFDIVLNRYYPDGKPCVDPVPHEEFLINSDHTSVDPSTARFADHHRPVMASDLVEMGYDINVVDSLPTDRGAISEEEAARDQDDMDLDNNEISNATRYIRLHECYVRMDMDGDGIAELYRVMCAGDSPYTLLGYEPADRIPFAVGTPWLRTHKHDGYSVYDRMRWIQDQKTALMRNIIDNQYHANNQRLEVVQGKVNLDDVLSSRPGAAIRVKERGSVSPIPSQPIGPAAFTLLEYMDKRRSETTGVNPDQAAQNQLMGGDTAHGVERLMSAKEKLVGLVVRLMGETLIKGIWVQLRELLKKHGTTMDMKFNDRWVQFDPASWRYRASTTINVGTGAGDKMRKQAAMTQVLAYQEKLAMHPMGAMLIGPDNVYQALDDWTKASDLSGADKYFVDPSSPRGQQKLAQMQNKPKEPDVLEKIAMLEAQSKMMAEETKRMKAQQDAMLRARDLDLKELKITEDTANKMTELEVVHTTNVPESRV